MIYNFKEIAREWQERAYSRPIHRRTRVMHRPKGWES